MDNQQERLASLDFIAGLVTGEGCFCFNIANRGRRATINPVFQLFMTDKKTVELVYRSLHAQDLPGYFDTRLGHGKRRNQYGIRLHGVKRLKRLSEALVPYLSGDKLRAAEIMRDFCNHRLSLDPKAGYGPVDVEFVARMREVNGNSKVNRTALEDLPRILRDYTSDMGRLSPKEIVRS